MAQNSDGTRYRALYDFEGKGWTIPDPYQKADLPSDATGDHPNESEWKEIGNVPSLQDLKSWWLGLAIFAFIWLAHSLAQGFPEWIFVISALFLVAVGAGISKWVAGLSRNVRKKLDYLIEDPTDEEVCLVSIVLRRGVVGSIGSDLWLARDEGIALFEDNALIFIGLRTSFRIGGQDVLDISESRRLILQDLDAPRPSEVLFLRPASRRISISFQTLPDSRKCADRARTRFWMNFRDFQVNGEPAEGTRTYPPFARF